MIDTGAAFCVIANIKARYSANEANGAAAYREAKKCLTALESWHSDPAAAYSELEMRNWTRFRRRPVKALMCGVESWSQSMTIAQ